MVQSDSLDSITMSIVMMMFKDGQLQLKSKNKKRATLSKHLLRLLIISKMRRKSRLKILKIIIPLKPLISVFMITRTIIF